MQIKIDGKIYDCQQGETILQVCRREKIKIPSLCYHPDLLPAEGLCRLCLVKTDRHNGLVTSCQTTVEDGMEVKSDDDDIEKARSYNLELLWADHAGKCRDCQRNGNCELQELAKEFKIDVDDFVPEVDRFEKEQQLKTLKESLKNRVVDEANPSIKRDNQYCIECRRCIKACRDIQGVEEYGMNHRSIETKVGTIFERPMDCILCGQCANYCPTAAIVEKDETEKLEKILKDEEKLKVFQVAPSVRFTLGEEFGLAPGETVEEKIPTALKKIGADLVFDTTFSADLTIMEEAHELVGRLMALAQGKPVKLPMFTSCCPSWVLYVEKYWPGFKDHLSSAKSPQQMLGALIKTYYAQEIKKINPANIVSISLMPCTAKKYEATREEMGRKGISDVDLVITTRELARYLKQKRIDLPRLKEDRFDRLMGTYSGAGIIFGSTGGVMEAALRTAYEKLTCQTLKKIDYHQVRGEEGIREASVVIPAGKCNPREIIIRVAVAQEIRNAKKLLEKIKRKEADYHFIEVMACPGGCLGGGGQPLPTDAQIRLARKRAIYQRDKNLPLRKSHENPQIKKIYDEFLAQPGGEKSEQLLHTKYFDKSQR